MTAQAIPYPSNTEPTKSIALQYREKGVVGDFLKGCVVCYTVHREQDTTVDLGPK